MLRLVVVLVSSNPIGLPNPFAVPVDSEQQDERDRFLYLSLIISEDMRHALGNWFSIQIFVNDAEKTDSVLSVRGKHDIVPMRFCQLALLCWII